MYMEKEVLIDLSAVRTLAECLYEKFDQFYSLFDWAINW